jgi:hypothetical protein
MPRTSEDDPVDYADVPAAGRDAELDPHFQELAARTSMVPTSYQPATVAGQQQGWRRAAAWALIALLVTATAGGVCLTYGPAELFRLLPS